MEIVVQANGTAICIYSETIPLTVLGPLKIKRASHVEPDSQGRWIADLSPVAGPQLGPFCNRSEALAAERQWLEANWLTEIS